MKDGCELHAVFGDTGVTNGLVLVIKGYYYLDGFHSNPCA